VARNLSALEAFKLFRTHFGDRQRFIVGEQMRRLLWILALRSAEEMPSGI
jgi:hypothetical protein